MHWTVSLAAQMYFSHIMQSVLLALGGTLQRLFRVDYQISLALTRIFFFWTNKLKYKLLTSYQTLS